MKTHCKETRIGGRWNRPVLGADVFRGYSGEVLPRDLALGLDTTRPVKSAFAQLVREP